MAQTRVQLLGWWCLLVLLGAFVVPSIQADRTGLSRFQADIGRFHFPISDDRLDDPHANDTLNVNLNELFYETYDYYFSFDEAQPIEVEGPVVDELARKRLSPEYARRLFNDANNSLEVVIQEAEPIAEPPGNRTWAVQHTLDNYDDFVWFYLNAINNMSISIFYYRIGAYMGVGQTVTCSSFINDVLSNKDEWSKAGSSAATTLMALVPTFLAFGNLYVPRSSEAFSTSPLVGLGCALYSLGLPVKSLSALKRDQVKSLAVLGFTTLVTIASFARVRKGSEHKTVDEGSCDELEQDIKPPTLSQLQGWMSAKTTGGLEDEARHIFAGIKQAVGHWKKRYHWWHAPAYVVVALQAVMFGLAIAPLLVNVGAPRFLLSCDTNWTGRYLGISAGANAILRYLMWQTGHHEQVKIFALSPKAKRKLQYLVHDKNKGQISSLEEEIPPLYPPLLTRIRAFIHPFYPGLFVKLGWMEESNSTYKAHLTPTIRKEWTEAPRNTARRYNTMLMWAIKNWRQVLQAGFFTHPPSAARRWRPLIVLLHLSSEGRNFLLTLLIGFFEAALLVILTFFFAAQWGGNLVITSIAIGLLLIFITLGRALGLLYVYLSSRVWGLHIIDCSTPDEILGSLRILCSMTDVIVVVNGASYFDGYRLNDMADYETWKSEYDGGVYDDDTESSIVGESHDSCTDPEGQSIDHIHTGVGAGMDVSTRPSFGSSSTERQIHGSAKGPGQRVVAVSTCSARTEGLPLSHGNPPEDMV